MQAEAGSRAEVYEAQVGKMQRALERADQETSRLEQELLAAQAALAFAGTGASGPAPLLMLTLKPENPEEY